MFTLDQEGEAFIKTEVVISGSRALLVPGFQHATQA
jgi:hypothetical protein